MPTLWLRRVEVIVYPADTLIMARLTIGMAKYNAPFVEGHRLDAKIAGKIPQDKIGKPLSRKQAEGLLRKL